MVDVENSLEKIPVDTEDASDDEISSDEDVIISKPKHKNAILSDDESSDNATQENNFNDEDNYDVKEDINDKVLQSRSRLIYSDSDSETEDKIDSKLKNDPSIDTTVKTTYVYNKDIFDTETSDEDTPHDSGNFREDFDQEIKSNLSENFSKTKKSAKKSLKSTSSFKESESRKQEIHSASQRMIRESEISLPYHRPKQRSLAEYMKRSNKNSVLSPTQNKRKSLKMSMRDVEMLRKIEERKKDVGVFYESGSDEEENALNEEGSCHVIGNENTESNISLENDSISGVIPLQMNSEETLIDLQSTSTDLPANGMPVASESSNQIFEVKEAENDLKDLLERPITPNNLISKLPDGVSESPISKSSKNVDDICATQNVLAETEETKLPTHCPKAKSDLETQISLLDDKKVLDSLNDASISCSEVKEVLAEIKNAIQSNTFVDDQEDSEDFKLQLDSEDIDDFNSNLSERSEEQSVPTSYLTRTPKISSILISKFPELSACKLSTGTPRLCYDSSKEFIDLDSDEESEKTLKPGANELLQRLVHHSNRKKKLPDNKKVELSIVSKEKGFNGDEKLVSSNIFVDLNEGQDDIVHEEPIPGARLVKLKSVLKAELLKQREKDIQRREKEKQFMDSEELIEDYDDDLPDEEAVLTDKSDTEYETESEPEENDVVISDKKRTKNQYLDEEAEDTDEDDVADEEQVDDERTNDSFKDEAKSDYDDENISAPKTFRRNIIVDDDDNAVNMMDSYSHGDDKIDNNSSRKPMTISRTSTEDLFVSLPENTGNKKEHARASSSLSLNTSLELMGSMIPGAQPAKTLESNNESFQEDELNNSAPLSLFSKFDCIKKSNSIDEKGFNLILTPMKNSQFSSNEQTDAMLPLVNESGTQNQDELLYLCSGNFSEKPKPLCDSFPATQDVNDLIGLCSGNFVSQIEPMSSQGFLTTGQSEDAIKESHSQGTENIHDEADGGLGKLHKPVMTVLSSDDEHHNDFSLKTKKKLKKRKRIVVTSDNESDAASIASLTDEEMEEFDDEERPVVKPKFSAFKDSSKGGIRSDFLDKEAELSGSEEGSGDEDEPDEDDDFMEREEGDMEAFDEDELRDQVGKAHMKTLIDKDKRELRLLQELYFEDGDLHGKGRKKNFRWRGENDQEQEDNNRHSEEEEQEDEAALEEALERRKLKLEKQKSLLKEHKNETNVAENDFTLKSSTSLLVVKNKAHKTPLGPSNSSHSQSSLFLTRSTSNHGSFLLRNTCVLEKLAEKMKENSTTSVKQSGNFVFHSLSAEEVEKKEATNRNRKAEEPPQKKQKVDRCFFSAKRGGGGSSSVFKNL